MSRCISRSCLTIWTVISVIILCSKHDFSYRWLRSQAPSRVGKTHGARNQSLSEAGAAESALLCCKVKPSYPPIESECDEDDVSEDEVFQHQPYASAFNNLVYQLKQPSNKVRFHFPILFCNIFWFHSSLSHCDFILSYHFYRWFLCAGASSTGSAVFGPTGWEICIRCVCLIFDFVSELSKSAKVEEASVERWEKFWEYFEQWAILFSWLLNWWTLKNHSKTVFGGYYVRQLAARFLDLQDVWNMHQVHLLKFLKMAASDLFCDQKSWWYSICREPCLSSPIFAGCQTLASGCRMTLLRCGALQEIEGFSYATALDLNMGYYTIRLDPEASEICTIIFPWGKYSYKSENTHKTQLIRYHCTSSTYDYVIII